MIRKSAILFLFLFVSAAAFAESGKTSLPYKEFIFEPGNLGPSHSPSIVELPGGELFAVWYAPTVWTEKAVIWGSRKLPGAKSWTEPSIIQYAGGYSNKNPVIYLNRDNKLLLFGGTRKDFSGGRSTGFG